MGYVINNTIYEKDVETLPVNFLGVDIMILLIRKLFLFCCGVAAPSCRWTLTQWGMSKGE